MKRLISITGFTLAELLISLVILGVIATFTIPKVLQSQQDQRYNAIAKENIATISGAYQILQSQGLASNTSTLMDLTPYISYINYDTLATTSIDEIYTYAGTQSCSAAFPCLHMHNGSLIYMEGSPFGSTETTSALTFLIDPDGKVTGSAAATGAGKSVRIFLHYNGKIQSMGEVDAGSGSAWFCCWSPAPAWNPPWFGW